MEISENLKFEIYDECNNRATVAYDDQRYSLSRGDIIFNTIHSVSSEKDPYLMYENFATSSRTIKFVENIFDATVTETESQVIAGTSDIYSAGHLSLNDNVLSSSVFEEIFLKMEIKELLSNTIEGFLFFIKELFSIIKGFLIHSYGRVVVVRVRSTGDEIKDSAIRSVLYGLLDRAGVERKNLDFECD